MRQKHIQYTYGASFTQLRYIKSACLSGVQGAGKPAGKVC